MVPNHAVLKSKSIVSAILILAAISLILFPNIRFFYIDARTKAYFSDAIQKAGIAYATVRVLNASVSVIQNSQLQLEPAGVGMSIAVGQVVDPVDDMTERLSDILVTAIVSLGIQRMVYEMAMAVAPALLGLLCLIALAVLWWVEPENQKPAHWLLSKLAVIILVGRFFLPFSAMVNGWLYEHYFLEDINQARQGLILVSDELGGFKDIELPAIEGLGDTLKNSARFLDKTASQVKKAVGVLTDNMGRLIENLLTLTWLYAGIFFIQVIALPVLMFWLMFKLGHFILAARPL